MKFIFSVVNLLFLLIPRFVSDTVAILVYEDDSWEILCLEEDLTDQDKYSAIANYKAFTFLGEDYFCAVHTVPDSSNV